MSDRVNIATIGGSRRHGQEDQLCIDRAARILFEEFGDDASEASVRAHLADPANVLLLDGDRAIAVVRDAASMRPMLCWMWVDPGMRASGIGGAFLDEIVARRVTGAFIRLNCRPSREAFFARHGFQRLLTARDGGFVFMAGPAGNRDAVHHLLPPSLRRQL